MKVSPSKTKLTEKQRQFVANKIAGCTNRDAAIAAGYSVAAASSTADKLMAMPAIRAALKATPASDGKPAGTQMPKAHYADPIAFLTDVMNHAQLPIAVRADAAKQLLPYKHARLGELGKKEKAKENATKIARGRSKFATKAPPVLRVVNNEEG